MSQPPPPVLNYISVHRPAFQSGHQRAKAASTLLTLCGLIWLAAFISNCVQLKMLYDVEVGRTISPAAWRWAAYLAAAIISEVAALTFGLDASVHQYVVGTRLTLIGNILLIIDAVLAAQMVRTIDGMQDAKVESVGSSAAPTALIAADQQHQANGN